MNQVFKIVWSHALNMLVVASEMAKSGGKKSSKTIGAIALTLGTLTAGSAGAQVSL